jgi:RimJ/RimL family protein N-acetyltransferase
MRKNRMNRLSHQLFGAVFLTALLFFGGCAPGSSPSSDETPEPMQLSFASYDQDADGRGRGLQVTMESSRIRLVSLREEQRGELLRLAKDPQVMSKYLDGTLRDEAWVDKVIKMWTDRWRAGDPLSSFAGFSKVDGRFLGIMTIGYNSEGGAELGGLSAAESWNQGHAKEAFHALIYQYIPELRRLENMSATERAAALGNGTIKDDWKMPPRVDATASYDNPASVRLLDSCCFGAKCGDLEPIDEIGGEISMDDLLALGFDQRDDARVQKTGDKAQVRRYNLRMRAFDSSGKQLVRTCENRLNPANSTRVVKMHFSLDLNGEAYVEALRQKTKAPKK